MASLIKDIENENAKKRWKTLLLFGGDAFSGTLISSEFKGEAEFKVLEALGVDAMVLGNHDFDYSLPVLEKRIHEVKFPVLAANVHDKKTRELITEPALTLITWPSGDSIYVVGLVSKNTPQLTNPKNVEGLVFGDPIKTAQIYLNTVRKHKQYVMRIALTHEGVAADVKLAEKTKGFDVIVGGHDHVRSGEYCRTVKKIPVCQTPANGKYLGKLDFEIDGKKVTLVGEELIPVEKEGKEDSTVAAIVDAYGKKVGTKYDNVIGQALSNFPAMRGGESPMGNLVADAIRDVAKTNIALMNSGGIRTSIKKGPITPRKVNEILPFDNYIVKLDLTGAEIEKILNFSVSKGGGAFLQISGATFSIEDKKAANIKIGGEPVEENKRYSVATLDFISNGGDGFTMLKSKTVQSLNIFVRDALIGYIKEKKRISAAPLGRITNSGT